MTKVTFYQGLRVIGGTFVAVETDRAICLFDFGFGVVDRNDDSIRLRPDTVVADYVRMGMLPAVDGIYDAATADILSLKPWGYSDKEYFFFISHMHIDHMGGLGLLDPQIPVYMSEDSLRLYRRMAVMGDLFYREHENCVGVPFGKAVCVGDICVEVLAVDHDVIGASGAKITTPDGVICYTGDYRFHGFHPEVTEHFGKACAGADLMITEGVSVSFEDVDMPSLTEPEPNIRTEEGLQQEMKELAVTEPGLLVINPYNRNVERVHRLLSTFREAGRILVLDAVEADYVSEFYPEDTLYVYEPTLNGHCLPAGATLVSRKELLAAPEKYVLQLDYGDSYELFDLKDKVSRYVHMDGAPLGAYDPSYARMLSFLEHVGIPYDYRGLGGHARPYYLKWMVDTISPRILAPLHSVRPEQVNSPAAGRQFLPEPGETLIL